MSAAENRSGKEGAVVELVENSLYVPRNLIISVASPPRGLSEEECWILKHAFETHVVELTGLYTGVGIEFDEVEGGFGYRETPLKQSPVFQFGDAYGRWVMSILTRWVTKSVIPYGDRNELVLEVLEPDPTYTHTVAAWIIGNIIPHYVRQPHRRSVEKRMGTIPIEMPIHAKVLERNEQVGKPLPEHLSMTKSFR